MEVNEASLNQIYSTFSTEQMNLMQSFKASDEEDIQKAIQKKLSVLNSLLISLIRFRNLLKQR